MHLHDRAGVSVPYKIKFGGKYIQIGKFNIGG